MEHREPLALFARARHLRWRDPLLAAGFVGGYVALDWLSYIHPMQQYSITPWNPQPALAVALLLLKGQAWLPAVVAAIAGAEWLVRGAPAGLPSTVVIAAVLSLAYAAIARAMAGRFAVHPAVASAIDVLHLVAIVSLGTLAAGVLYIAALLAAGLGPLDQPFIALARFWIGDSVGIVVTLPLVLMMSRPERRRELRAMLRRPEAVLHGLAIAAAVAAVFLGPPSQQAKLSYVLFLPLIVAATRFGMLGASLAALLIQGGVIASGELAGYHDLTVFEFQALLIALTATGLFLGATVDERRKAADDVRRTLRLAAAGEMAAALAHELNQPLTAVANYARASQLLAGREGDRALLLQTLDKLTAESSRAADVVKRLRDFFRSGETRLAPVNVAVAAREVIDSMAGRSAASGVTVTLSGPGDAVVHADRVQVQVVLRNLVDNAIRAAASAPSPRQVRVHVALDKGQLLLSVQDSGAGVEAADAERIFEPLETSGTTGMGMGLAISRAIVEAHGGRLWAEPRGHGLFCMALPARTGDA